MPKPCPYKGDVARAMQQGTQRNFRNFVPSLPSRNLPARQLLANNGRTEGNFLKQTWGPKIPHTSMGESILFSTLSTNIFFVYCKLCWRRTPTKKLKARNGPWARRISLVRSFDLIWNFHPYDLMTWAHFLRSRILKKDTGKELEKCTSFSP